MASEYGWMPTDEGVMEFESNEVARHALECIRACKGVRNPAAVGDLIAACRARSPRAIREALAALDKDPTL